VADLEIRHPLLLDEAPNVAGAGGEPTGQLSYVDQCGSSGLSAQPSALADATFHIHGLRGSLLRALTSVCCLRPAKRPVVASGSGESDRLYGVDAAVVYPVIELVDVEADVAAHLDDGDAPLVGQPTHVAFTRAQPKRNILEGEESNRRAILPAHRTPQGAAG
jgi:hypothetical protein